MLKEQQIEMVGPTRQNASWQSKTEGAYDETRFYIDWSAETVTCPEGKQSKSWKTFVKDVDREYIKTRFSSSDCSVCAAKELCTRSPARSVAFLTPAEVRSARAGQGKP